MPVWPPWPRLSGHPLWESGVHRSGQPGHPTGGNPTDRKEAELPDAFIGEVGYLGLEKPRSR